MGVFDFLHPQGVRDDKRDALVDQKTVDGNTVHWGKRDFSAAEYAQFQQSMKGIEMSDKQLSVLQAVHDGTPIPGTGEIKSPDNITTQKLMDKSTIDKEGNLHIDKLVVDKALVEDFSKVMKNGPADPEFAAMMQKASKDGCHLVLDEGANSRASSAAKTVWWDPSHVATDYHNEASMSARDVLKHEMSHELRDPEITRVLQNIPAGVKTNVEEEMAIAAEHRHMDPNQYQRDSHEANTVKTQPDPTVAPQVCEPVEFGVKVTPIVDGKPAAEVYKSSGQIKGHVEDVRVEHETNPDGTMKVGGATTNVITIKDDRGKVSEMRFGDGQYQDLGVENKPHVNPIKTLTQGDPSDPRGVQKGDDITIDLNPRNQTATLTNRTQAYEKVVDSQANVVGGRDLMPEDKGRQPAGIGIGG